MIPAGFQKSLSSNSVNYQLSSSNQFGSMGQTSQGLTSHSNLGSGGAASYT